MRIDAVVVNAEKTIRQIIKALRNNLTFDDNMQCKIIEISNTGLASVAIPIAHNLGKIPTVFIANLDVDGTVWAVNKSGWTITDMEVACSASNAALTLVVF